MTQPRGGGDAPPGDLPGLVAAELAVPVDPRVTAMAAAIAAQYGTAARAMLFYGSCLRAAAGEGGLDGQMLDFYLIVSDYEAAYGKGWLARANRLVPPNVFPFAHDGLAAKYAVLSEADLARECGTTARSVSVWARFAQPARLVWTRDAGAAARTAASVAQAAVTLFRLTLPVAEGPPEPLAVWRCGFALTYGAELRAERNDRSGGIVDADPARYDRFGRAALAAIAQGGAALASRQIMTRRWRAMQRHGKWLTAARLAKATTTFAGGIDYLAWKINRHADAGIVIRPWQRRHPILGAMTLLPKLMRKGAVR
ncbi:MAG: hypothetical protein ABW173_12655 [Sphingomonas sp.]